MIGIAALAVVIVALAYVMRRKHRDPTQQLEQNIFYTCRNEPL